MKTRAAVAFAANQPLEIVTLDLEGPRAGEVMVEIRRPASAIPTPTRCRGWTRKAFSPPCSGMRAQESWWRSGRA